MISAPGPVDRVEFQWKFRNIKISKNVQLNRLVSRIFIEIDFNATKLIDRLDNLQAENTAKYGAVGLSFDYLYVV
jgi:hypothetical protein